ncbi:sigma-54 interaction domain-containing protein [Geosporobacter ferrireducens]|uniref:Sigma-54-dependent Fis family transcriptional regulator n=1 Tax=Geosporobacter ferrireducens TaxID=1424294 RepID=A0A1D8GDS4_9FIRM|nr:sigma 54-interacting transcriptional regulator [Geosporobacter ferrireducens]AOT69057.1 sigma-54-dependent Fis family transcriptional regulator [Geosporobacter ferrireducens]MTI56726.1 AAA family ATPase [Geosporobacter ferrireducens]
MFTHNSYIHQFTDMMSEGFIFIDHQGNIQIYNRKAKEIFGVIHNQGIGHEAGRLEPDDIVIIADNCLGKDDGGLTPKDLSILGIRDKGLEMGDSIIAIGVYKGEKILPVYKYRKGHENWDTLNLEAYYCDLDIDVSIDNRNREIHICVNQQDFYIEFVNSIGHIVIVEGQTQKVKFYQSRGYTVRGESIGDILKGKPYRAKGKGTEELNVIGKNIFEIHMGGPTINEFYDAATGKDLHYRDKFREINGRSTLCTLLPVDHEGKRMGAVLKVEDISELRRVIRERDEALKSVDEMERKLRDHKTENYLFPEITGESQELFYAKKLAYKASKTNSTVLLLGESGTGKTLFARAIHDESKYHNQPFVHINCASIPENLLESELFGYEKGAFTGAKNEGKIGLFEAARGGTIFLDEIGELTPYLQGKLLQALQSKTFIPVGGTKTITVEVRIIAATNKNLEEEMLQGRFREDLYYRINVFPIMIPPLRQRKQDIHSLVYALLPKICERIGSGKKAISGEALQALVYYDWPGNIRELENVLERAANIAEGSTILSSHLAIPRDKRQISEKSNQIRSIKEVLEETERKAIERALRISGGKKQAAMKALGIGKTQFYEKLKKYKLDSSENRN